MRALITFISIVTISWAVAAHAASRHPVVGELFTSQGCSSCPPADALASLLNESNGVLILSYHVDYWDKLGWKDPLSSAANTQRQKDYARALGTKRIYTPQMVVNGTKEMVGSYRQDVKAAMNSASFSQPWIEPDLTITAATEASPASLTITLEETDDIYAEIYLVGFKQTHRNKVNAGENKGATLSHVNSVMELRSLGMWDGRKRTYDEPVPKGDSFAIIVQQPNNGPIIGAVWPQESSE